LSPSRTSAWSSATILLGYVTAFVTAGTMLVARRDVT
jgi:hypothetical protein